MANEILRVHPAIGVARVGNSDEYYIAPETPAAYPDKNGHPQTGGLPIKPGTESTTITDRDIRDTNGALKKQAARFRVYQYPAETQTYPTGAGTEVTIGSTVGDRTVTDIIWTVHLANKKANCYLMPEPDTKGTQIVDSYKDCGHPPVRNPESGSDLNAEDRRTKLHIDPGPRAIRATAPPGTRISFDAETTASYWETGDAIASNPDYPQSFPYMHFPDLYSPVEDIRSLGALETESDGRLLVIPSNGTACGFSRDAVLDDDVNNDHWFDDVADGPIRATVVFDDGTTQEVQGGWVITTDPGYAPQVLNIVSLWDDMYHTFVEEFDLSPSLFRNGVYQETYTPSFEDEVYPIFRAAAMQQWSTNLPAEAISGHRLVDRIGKDDDPAKYLHVKSIIRDPNNWEAESEIGSPRMPLSLGDSGMSFLMVSKTQYFFLTQWFENRYSKRAAPALGPGEYLDKATLINCLGGRFSPGIDMTFIVRQPDLWKQNWPEEGPFRINAQSLDYSRAGKDSPFLSAGWFPLRGKDCQVYSERLEPGDTSKFMALPWHTDYNSCATHTPSPNPPQNLTLYWSWPAQRPVAVYAAADVKNGKLGKQRFSVRGADTATSKSSEVGRYPTNKRIKIVENWEKIGVVLQATAITDADLPEDFYLEVESRLENEGNAVIPWPNTVRDKTRPADET